MDGDFINQFKQTIEAIVDARMTNYGITRYVAAIVKKVNGDGTVDVILPPDDKNVISSLANKSGEFLRVGDSVEVCTKNGKMSNAWISTKHGKDNNVATSENYYQYSIARQSTGGYLYLGDVTLSALDTTCVITVFNGNMWLAQNTIARLYLKKAENNIATVSAEYYINSNNQQFMVFFDITNKPGVFSIYLKNTEGVRAGDDFGGSYIVEGTYNKYEPVGTFSTKEPVGTQWTIDEQTVCYQNKTFPVGFIVMTATNTNPQTYLGGVWTAFGQGRMLVGVDTTQSEFDTALKTGGEKEVTLSVEQMPSHGHSITHAPTDASLFSAVGGTELNSQVSYMSGNFNGWKLQSTADNTGGGQAHNNMSPYITVYMWRRTA